MFHTFLTHVSPYLLCFTMFTLCFNLLMVQKSQTCRWNHRMNYLYEMSFTRLHTLIYQINWVLHHYTQHPLQSPFSEVDPPCTTSLPPPPSLHSLHRNHGWRSARQRTVHPSISDAAARSDMLHPKDRHLKMGFFRFFCWKSPGKYQKQNSSKTIFWMVFP